MPSKLTTTDKLRRDIKKIAEDNLSGVSLDAIGKKYKCSRFLIIRVMRQELPEDFWAERARRKARVGKVRESRPQK